MASGAEQSAPAADEGDQLTYFTDTAMTTTASKRIANQASAAKRTASSLRSIAESGDLDIADRGVLITASRILDTHAKKKAVESKTKKAAEEKLERDRLAALREAIKLVSELPQATTLERIAFAYMCYQCGYLQQLLDTDDHPEKLQRALTMSTDDAMREEAGRIAYKAAKEGKPVNHYQPELVARFNLSCGLPDVARIAQRFDAATSTLSYRSADPTEAQP